MAPHSQLVHLPSQKSVWDITEEKKNENMTKLQNSFCITSLPFPDQPLNNDRVRGKQRSRQCGIICTSALAHVLIGQSIGHYLRTGSSVRQRTHEGVASRA